MGAEVASNLGFKTIHMVSRYTLIPRQNPVVVRRDVAFRIPVVKSEPTVLPNIRMYVLCHNYERFTLAKKMFADYYWGHPIMMKYQDMRQENAFWKQLLEIESEWESCDMVGTLSPVAFKT